jgi:hypothetical protein
MDRTFGKSARIQNPEAAVSIQTEGQMMTGTSDRKTEGTVLILVPGIGLDISDGIDSSGGY